MKKLKVFGIASMMLMFVSFASAQNCEDWETAKKRWIKIHEIVTINGECYQMKQPWFKYYGDPNWIPGGPGLLAIWRKVDCSKCDVKPDCGGAEPWEPIWGKWYFRNKVYCLDGKLYRCRQGHWYFGDPSWKPNNQPAILALWFPLK